METENQRLFIKIMIPLEFGRDFCAVTDKKRSRTVCFTCTGDFGIPCFLFDFITIPSKEWNYGDIMELDGLDWESFDKIIKDNKEKYEILTD